MHYVNNELLYKIPSHYRGIMEYYPDVILFNLNQTQYTYLWQQIHSATYLYTNGYQIKPIGWLGYVFESFKGWLGFENHCHPGKIFYTLNKLAYYGYSKRYTQPAPPSGARYSMTVEFGSLVNNRYNDITTEQLQTLLTKNFFKIEPHLTVNYQYQRLNSEHRFGESWVVANQAAFIPLLDPQDSVLIERLVHRFDQQNLTVHFLQFSKYARVAARYYYDKAAGTSEPSFLARLLWVDPRPGYLAQALAYYPDIDQLDPARFIEYYLQKEAYLRAFNLLQCIRDPELILKFLLDMPAHVRNNLVPKDSEMATILAQHYIKRKQYTDAQQFHSNIESLSLQASFSLALRAKDFAKAYDIFKRLEHPNSVSVAERKTLAAVFFNKAEKEYDAGKECRDHNRWTEAGEHYLHCLEHKKAAYDLNPADEYLESLYTHKRLYAQVLIDADTALHAPEASNIAVVRKAINLLKECQSQRTDEQNCHKAALAKGYMRVIDTLREKICFVYTPHDLESLEQHKELHKLEISVFIKTLNKLIALLEGTKDDELRLKLGKAHYLLADVCLFFDINDPSINEHYKMAMVTVPENPFYTLRVGELFEIDQDKNRDRGILGLKKRGFEVFDYNHWFDERWVKKESIIHNIKDIHQPSLSEPKSSAWRFGF